MSRNVIAAAVVAAALGLSGGFLATTAFAKSDAEIKAQLEECKKLADPKAKDECVKKVGQGAEKAEAAKESKGGKKPKGN
ncbi:hypothetical protein AAFN88_11100 [Pelagibius sp. CAU 1746]|uniref:hypothetical protein n=1 Tax=Pelagibius sp. CAU 1746 TaxID=3140370 RepID=UPI00325C01F7